MHHWFQFVLYGVLALFTGILISVAYVAYSRQSGFTGQDMAQIQKIRYEDSSSHLNTKAKN